jgi:hypothetical protein
MYRSGSVVVVDCATRYTRTRMAGKWPANEAASGGGDVSSHRSKPLVEQRAEQADVGRCRRWRTG